MASFSFDSLGFQVDGRDQYLVSGEFHYFRVPRQDWKRRMQLFKEAGGNCLATYVPWLIHEPTEGDIRFGDVDNRDLQGFLRLAQEEGLKVLLRPGPYQYSELDNAGLPGWLMEHYPQVMAMDIQGKPFHDGSVSYLHPILLEKARVYYRAFAEQVRPFMMENGGPVCMLQVDNELIGIHVWFGSLDYNPETMGFGRADGRYPRYLKEKYADISALNAAYESNYPAFEQVMPIAQADRTSAASCRRVRDYHEFYLSTIAEYAHLLASWLREDGLNGPICHNSANPNMNCLFPETVAAMDKPFLLGSDHYYTLNPGWAQNNPTPQYALRVLSSCDTLRAMGMPPVALELPGGSPSDTPPILPGDLLACYMANLALGLKGVNYYVYTGGPNFPNTGTTCDIYDYNAHVHADGSLNETYESLKTFGKFMESHAWMQRAHRVASVQVGFEWNTMRCEDYDLKTLPFEGARADRFMERGVLYTLMCSRYSPELVSLTGDLDLKRPLIVPSPSAMSEAAQLKLLDFIRRGGKALILPVLPEVNWDYQSANLLGQMMPGAVFNYDRKIGPAVRVDGVGRVFGINRVAVCEHLPEGAQTIAWDDRYGHVLGFETAYGAGKLIWFGGVWEMSTFDQAVMLEHLLERLDVRPCVASSNRNLFTSLWTDESGRRELFVMNLYSGAQSTTVHVYAGGERVFEDLKFEPMEVKAIEL